MEADAAFVPDGFEPPLRLATAEFVLEPLGSQHNERDYEAWTSSIDHILATPGFRGAAWPSAMTLAENLEDLEKHARDFVERRGFTYTVLDPATSDVIGCVYIYPVRQGDACAAGSRGGRPSASIRSWVSADRACLDEGLRSLVTHWLESDLPFEIVDYASRHR